VLPPSKTRAKTKLTMKTNTIPPAPSIQTYALDLGDGVKCDAQVIILPDPARHGEFLFRMTQLWQGSLRNDHWPDYSAWIQEVWQSIADATDKQLLSVFNPPRGESFAVAFVPNQPRQVILLPRR
jgi:hypothetical protein